MNPSKPSYIRSHHHVLSTHTSTGTTEYCSISEYNPRYIYSLDSPLEHIIKQSQSPPSLLHSDYTLIVTNWCRMLW